MTLRLSCVLFCAAALLPAQDGRARVQALSASRADLNTLSDSIETLARKVNQAVVQIFSTSYAIDDDSQSDNGKEAGYLTKQRSSGSGVVLSPDGYILTNYHVVKNARRVRVQFASNPGNFDEPGSGTHAHGKLLEAKVVGFDREADLAVIKIEPPSPLAVLTPLYELCRLATGNYCPVVVVLVRRVVEESPLGDTVPFLLRRVQ